MKRRSLLLLGALAPIALLKSRYLGAKPAKHLTAAEYQQQAIDLNDLAANIQTPDDARRLVDFLSDIFSNETPYRWKSRSIRNQLAQAEFASVSDPEQLIPDAHLAQAWNAYVDTIGAPAERKVTATELHNLRDGFLTTATVLWRRVPAKNFWTAPAIYATLPDGSIAPGSRAIESVRILWDLSNMPGNLDGARDRLSKGQLVSTMQRERDRSPQPQTARGSMLVVAHNSNPIQAAQWNYIQAHGDKAFSNAVLAMLDNTLAIQKTKA